MVFRIQGKGEKGIVKRLFDLTPYANVFIKRTYRPGNFGYG
jgi:hypothetical protein